MESSIKFNKFRRKQLYYLILINLVNLVKSDSCIKNRSFITKEGINECYHNHSTINTCQSNITGLNISESDQESGTAEVEFDFDYNCIYDLELYYINNSNKDNCSSIYNPKDENKHSAYKYEGKYLSQNDVVSTSNYCKKKGVIKLKHLSTGCYRIELNNKITRYKYFTVNQKKIHFNDFVTNHTFLIQYLYDQSKVNAKLRIKHPYLQLHPTVILKISQVNPPIVENIVLLKEYIVPNVINDINKETKYSACKSNIEISCYIRDEDEIFMCNIMGLNPGEYKFEFSFNNIIQCFECLGCTFWKDTCCLVSKTRDTEQERPPLTLPSQISPDTSDIFSPWIIIIIILSLLAIMFIFIIHYRNYIWNISTDICKTCRGNPRNVIEVFSNQDKLSLIDNEREVLLLYPRDAEPVMLAMEAFRNALRVEGFQVYDIFDENQLQEISEGPNKWISDKLDKNTTKIIIVRTYCGNLLLRKNCTVDYKDPDFRDNLFLFAMARLHECYNNHDIMTVDVGMSTSYSHSLKSKAIYDLPDNVQKLLENLRNNQDYSINVEDKTQNNNEWNEFTTAIKNMQDYVENKKYLKDLLKVDFVENGKLLVDLDADIRTRENNQILC